jgi:hypothetical protein
MKIKIFIIFLILGCTNIRNLPEGGVRPKNIAKFELSKQPCFLKNDAGILDTNAIYLNRKTIFYENSLLDVKYDSNEIAFLKKIGVLSYMRKEASPDTMYYFYRFFKNGRVYISKGSDHFPTINEQNDFRRGLIGYYKIEDSRITVETFFPINFGQYIFYYGVIKQDTIIFTESDVLHVSKKDKYVKTKGKGIFLYSKPNW